MIHLANKRKVENYKKSHQSLYKLITVLFLLLSPLILIFAPLPGYLLIHPTHYIPAIFSTVFFILLFATESIVYWRHWTRAELQFFKSINANSRALVEHFESFIQTSVVTHIFIWGALFKADFTVWLMIYLTLIYTLVFIVFIFIYWLRFELSTSIVSRFKAVRVIKLLTMVLGHGVYLRATILFVILFTSHTLQANGVDEETFGYFAIVFFVLILYFHQGILQLVLLNLSNYKNFLLMLSPVLWRQLHVMLVIIMLIFFTVSLLINFAYLL